jgi:hypothetical protein
MINFFEDMLLSAAWTCSDGAVWFHQLQFTSFSGSPTVRLAWTDSRFEDTLGFGQKASQEILHVGHVQMMTLAKVYFRVVEGIQTSCWIL